MEPVEQRNFRLVVAENEEQMGRLSGKDLVDLLQEYTVDSNVPVVLNLAAAPSQNASYAEVVNRVGMVNWRAWREASKLLFGRRDMVNWKKVHIIHLDDYHELPRGHPNTFESYLRKHLIDSIDIPESNVLYIKGVQERLGPQSTVDQVAEAYSRNVHDIVERVKRLGGVHIAHIGYGVNGHMAFVEPHVDKHDTRWALPVEIDETSVQQQYDDYFDHPNPAARYHSIEDVPRLAVTMSMAGILDADHIICVVPGVHKSQAVRNAVDGELTDLVPASWSRMARDFSLYLTPESAALLKRPPTIHYH